MGNLHYELRLSNIKLIAKSNNITIKDLAVKSGMSEPGLIKSIKRNNINTDNLVNIANNLNKPISCYFLKQSEWNISTENVNEVIKERDKLRIEVEELKNLVISLTKKIQ